MATFDNITLEIIEDSADKTGLPVKARVKYNEFDKEVPGSVLETILRLFLAQEKSSLTPVEFVNKVRGVTKDGPDKEPPKPEPPKPEPGKDSDEEEKDKDKKKKKKKKDDKEKSGAGRIVIKWVAGLSALAILAVGGCHVYKHLFKGGKQDSNTPPDITPPPAIEQHIEEPVTTEPIIDVELPHDELLPYVNRGSTDWIAMSDEEYLDALTSQTIASQMNMPEISIFVEGGELEGEKHISHLENSFRKQSPDFCIVEYFNQCRNDVVNAAYDTRNRDNVRIVQDLHVRDMYLFITNQKSVTLNTSEGEKTFYWNTISDEARNAIADTFIGLIISLDHNYVLVIDGATFTPQQLAEFAQVELGKLTLINPTFRR